MNPRVSVTCSWGWNLKSWFQSSRSAPTLSYKPSLKSDFIPALIYSTLMRDQGRLTEKNFHWVFMMNKVLPCWLKVRGPSKRQKMEEQRPKAPRSITHFREIKVFVMVSIGSLGKITTWGWCCRKDSNHKVVWVVTVHAICLAKFEFSIKQWLLIQVAHFESPGGAFRKHSCSAPTPPS